LSIGEARPLLGNAGTAAGLEHHGGGDSLRLDEIQTGVLATRQLGVLHRGQKGVAEEGTKFYSDPQRMLARNPGKSGLVIFRSNPPCSRREEGDDNAADMRGPAGSERKRERGSARTGLGENGPWRCWLGPRPRGEKRGTSAAVLGWARAQGGEFLFFFILKPISKQFLKTILKSV